MAKYYELHEDVLPMLKKQNLDTNVNRLMENVHFFIGGEERNTKKSCYYCYIKDFAKYEKELYELQRNKL